MSIYWWSIAYQFVRWRERRRNRRESDRIAKEARDELAVKRLKNYAEEAMREFINVGMTPIKWIARDDKNEVATIWVIDRNNQLLAVKVGVNGGLAIGKI